MLSRDAKWGWVITDGKSTHPARVLASDLPGHMPWAATMTDSPDPAVLRFNQFGIGSHHEWFLLDAPAPKASGEIWLNVWRRKGQTSTEVVEHGSRQNADAEDNCDGKYERLACLGPLPWTEGMGLEAEGTT